MQPLVIHIQKCSIHDGPGIRTTIFFKGCPLSCAWCHNPESQSYTRQLLYDEERCTGCGACIPACGDHAIFREANLITLDRSRCSVCGKCTDVCVHHARQIVGEEYSVESLVREIEKDRMFYEESGGGVTFSGGEVMARNMDFICELARKCKSRGIHVAVDTCGYAPYEHFQRILNDTDLFLYDVKVMDNEKHIRYTGRSNEIILENLQKLARDHAQIHLRVPLIPGVNMDDDYTGIRDILKFAAPLGITHINLLPYHRIGKHKYNRLSLVCPGDSFEPPAEGQTQQIKQICHDNGFHVKIGG